MFDRRRFLGLLQLSAYYAVGWLIFEVARLAGLGQEISSHWPVWASGAVYLLVGYCVIWAGWRAAGREGRPPVPFW